VEKNSFIGLPRGFIENFAKMQEFTFNAISYQKGRKKNSIRLFAVSAFCLIPLLYLNR